MWTLTNAGTVSESGRNSIGIDLATAGTITNATGGNIAGADYGMRLAGGGLVSAQAGGTISGYFGVYAYGGALTLVNAGSIAGNVTSGAAVILAAGGIVTNLSGGTLSGSYGVNAQSVAATVVNAGSIGDGTSLSTRGIELRHGGSITNQSGGVILAGRQGIYFAGAAGTLTNAGSIGGSPTTGNGVLITAGGTVSNQSGGVITGRYAVRAVLVAETVINAGSLGGDLTNGGGVYLSAGGAVTNQSGGTINGFTGVYAKTVAATVVNAGSIAGGTVSGRGVFLQAGGTITNQSGGMISGGADAVTFAPGFTNRLVIDPRAGLTGTADGGNTIGGASISTLELASGTSAGTLSGLGTQFINFAQDDIDPAADWILGGANTLITGATLTNSGTLTDTGTFFNNGTLAGNHLDLVGGVLTNQAGGLVTSASAYSVHGAPTGGADAVVNLGTIANSQALGFGVYLAGVGNVSNAAGALIDGYSGVKLYGVNATLVNLGQITGSIASSGPSSYGVYLRNGGLITNGQATGSTTSTASIQGYTGLTFKTADTINALGTLINYGTVRGTGTAGADGALLSNAGTVLNGQGGATAAVIEGYRYGISSGAGPVTNDATIIATGTAGGDYGIAIGGPSSVGNLGTASLIEGYGGVQIGLDGTVTNAGTIASNQGASGVAVDFTGGDARLIDDPGAVFVGSIDGGTGGTAVLELASGASAGTVSGLGSTVTNFTSLVFDAGVAWTVRGNDAANGLGTLGISGFTIGDTIDLGGFVATSETFASNALVLSDGDTTDTLNIQGTFSSGNFTIASDGSTGTDITEGVAGLGHTLSSTITTAITLTSPANNPFTITSIGEAAPTAASATAIYAFGGAATNWTITNAGIVAGGPSAGSNGIDLGRGGAHVTSGTIINQGGGTITGSNGVSIYNDVASSIVNQAGATIAAFGAYGVVLRTTSGGTVTNAGVISAPTAHFAVLFAQNSPSNRVIDDPGAVFIGKISGGGGVLELASAAGAGTISGLGGTVTNFTSLVFDTGAQWTVGGNDLAGGLGTLGIGGFTVGDTIDLTGFAAVTETFASNMLMLSDGDTTETLNIQGAFSSSNFTIASDGSTGTDITFAAGVAALVYGATIDETGIVAASETVAAGVMTLFNGGAAAVGTIVVGTSLSTGDFILAPANGDTGTDVILNTVFGSYTSGVTVLVNPTTIASAAQVFNVSSSGNAAAAVYGPAAQYWTLTNQGTVSATGSRGDGINLRAGGLVINGISGTISGDYGVHSNQSATVENNGSINGNTGAAIYLYGGTVVNSGVLADAGAGDGVFIYQGASVTNLSGGMITAATRPGIYVYQTGSVTNAGTIRGGSEGVLGPHALTVANTGVILATGTAGRGVVLETGGFVTNSSSGTISAGIYGIFIGGAAGTVDNAGTIQASAGGGVYLYTGTIQNSGLIVGSNRNGVYINGDGSVTNQPGGTITGATGVKFTGVGNVANYGSMQGASTGVDGVGLNVTNTGVILGTGTSSDAIDLASGYVTNSASGTISGGNIGVRATNGPVAIDNSGTIQGTAGRGIFLAGGTVVNSGLIAGGSAASAAYSSGAASITNLSTGTMAAGTGVDFAGESKNTLTNSDTIIGSAGTAVSFAAGGTDRLVDNPGAVFTGDINGGNTATSVLELASAASAGTISGFNGTTVTNFATLQFDAGAQWTVAGNDLANGLGTLDIDGFTSGDTIDLTGFAAISKTFASNVLALSDGDSTDTLNIQGAFSSSNFTIASDGSTGTDITFGAGVTALVYGATIDEAGIVAASETVTAGTLTLFDGSGTAVGTIVVGTSLSTGDFMLRSDGGSGTEVIVNTVFGIYSSGVTLLTNPTTIASTAQVSNPANGGSGVSGPAGTAWTVTNLGTIAESGSAGFGISLASGGTVVNAGEIADSTGNVGVYMNGPGSFTNQMGGTITGATHDGVLIIGAGNVANNGTITAGYRGIYGTGVLTVTNTGVIRATATSGLGVSLIGGGFVTNSLSGNISGNEGIGLGSVDATVDNSGTVVGTASVGIYVYTGAVTNSGLVAGDNVGIYIHLDGGVTNLSTGTITAAFGVVFGDASTGTLVNAGTIDGTGGHAVIFQGIGTHDLIVDPGAVFIGNVYGGSAGATAVMELASGSSAGTIAGFGGTVTNFTSLVFDAGAHWTVAGNDSASGLGTLGIGGFASGDTIDLTGFVATSSTFASNVLVLSDGDTTETLNIQGGFSTGNFLLSNDDDGGTDVSYQQAPAVVTGTLANIGMANETPSTPFTALTVTDAIGASEIVTVTLSNPAFGALSNLDGGNYDGTTGVYTVAGSPDAVSSAIDGLVLTPAAPESGVYVSSTTLTVDVVGPGGGPAALTAITASVQQVLGLASVPGNLLAISVSSDGTDFAAPIGGDTNEAVVTSATDGGTYILPTGYQAEFLGGSANATLQDTGVGNAVLVGNTGNDVLIGGGASDSIVAGNGNNTLEGGTGAIALVVGDGNDSITTAADSSYIVALGSGSDTFFVSSSGTITSGTGSDLIDATGAGVSLVDTIVLQGLQDTVLGGAGSLTVVDNGAHDTIQAGSGATAVTLDGSFGRIRGGTGSFTVDDQTAGNTVIGGTAGTMFVTVGAGASDADVFGRAGNTSILDLGADALIGAGGGTSDVSIGGAGTQLYGASAPGGTLNVSIGAANVLVFGLGDNTTVDASNAAATGALVFGGFSSIAADNGSLSVQGGADSLVAFTGGSNSTINAGTGDLYAYIGTGSIAGSNLINGARAGALYVAFLGGAGSATVYGGEAAASVFGVDGSDVTYVDTLVGARGAFLVANGSAAGSETLNAAGSAMNDSLFAAQGNIRLVAGSGTDFLDAGANTGSLGGAGTVVGGDTMVAGGSSDLMFFSHGAFEGGAVVINFSSADTVILSGYNSVAGAGGNQASTALADATTAGGDTTIALADGTHITFVDATAAQLQGHVFSS